jgi:L,D-transpeptidase ErfK/SrfK
MWPLVVAVLLAKGPDAAPPRRDEVIGALDVHLVRSGESLIEIARRHDLGFNEIAAANPRLDPFVPRIGAKVVLATEWILPEAAARGTLVVNLSEMRLYLIPASRGAPVTFPVGVGVEPGATPLGSMTVVGKAVRPTWHPTPSTRLEDPALPAEVPPGPDNPLGSHALRLSNRRFLIHGTNRPFGVGRKVSRGCVRLYPEDIPELFRLVPVGMPVTIVREPVKVGIREGRVLVEVHDDPAAGLDALAEAERLLEARALLGRVDARELAAAVRERSGIPVDVTADPD